MAYLYKEIYNIKIQLFKEYLALLYNQGKAVLYKT